MKTTFVKRLLAIRLFGCVGLAVVVLSTVCKADFLEPFRFSQITFCLASDESCTVVGTIPFNPLSVASLNETLNNSEYALTATGRADASFGVLHSSAYLNVAMADTATNMTTRAGFFDIITIDFPPFNGETGYLNIDYTLDGTISQTGLGYANSIPEACAGTVSNVCQDNQLNPFGHESSSLTISNLFSFSDPFTFTYGTPFGLLFELQTYAVADGSGTANSDFANTLVLSGLHPFGPDMQPVTGATFTSVSGTQYSQNGVISASPEPSSSVLVVSALAILLGVGFRRRIRYAARFRHESANPINCISPNVA